MDEPGKRGGRTQVWPPESAAARGHRAPRWAADLSYFAESVAGRLKGWALTDIGTGRLLPWLPIAFGLGIVLYFTAEQEPAWWSGLALTGLCTAIAVRMRSRFFAFAVALAFAAIAAGFFVATLRSLRVAHPILPFAVSNVAISGFVEIREERERSDRIVIRISSIEGLRSGEKLERVRLSVRKGMAPAVGSFISLKARLNPPLQPLRPGGYDFARDLYFQGIGASGFVLGPIRQGEATAPPGLWLRYATLINGMRDAIDARIRANVSGDRGSIASALITGKRDAISASVNDAMYVSSLAHVLSISGYHMAVVAGVVFFTVRAALALFPSFANRYAIKKWAALTALGAAAFYLLLSGAEVATQRSFIMTAIVLLGVMCDRPALTLRTIAVAAFAVLLLAPEAVVHPSFQMSFAATLVLVAGYERGLPWFSAVPDTPLGMRIALWGGREVTGLILVSLLAGLATTPFAAFHFHRLAPYGTLANLLAMPIVSAWVMPAGLFGLAAMPFGFDGLFWRLMGEGIGWMIAVALWVANLPGAVGRIAAFGTGPLLLCAAGIVVTCLLRTPLRWSGLCLAAAAGIWAVQTPSPEIYVSGDGHLVAVRNAKGQLSIMKQRNDDFIVREWLAADADARKPRDVTLADETRCDASGCIAMLPDKRKVALALEAEAMEEDCRRTVLIVTARQAVATCAALMIDRNMLRDTGALALRRTGSEFEITRARPAGHQRPWMRPSTSVDNGRAPAIWAPRRDATPRFEDLEADD